MTEESYLKCLVCSGRVAPAGGYYCKPHQVSMVNLRMAFEIWQTGYGNIRVENFLKKVLALKETGSSAKEAAQFLLQNLDKW